MMVTKRIRLLVATGVAALTAPEIVDVPNVVEAQRLFGSPDYLLRVVTADLASYQRLYQTRRIPSRTAGT